MGMYLSDGMYSTNCDSSEEDELKYCKLSSDKSGESANRQSTSEEDAFSLSLETQIPLESMTFFRLGNP
jgi:hypothetical protein